MSSPLLISSRLNRESIPIGSIWVDTVRGELWRCLRLNRPISFVPSFPLVRLMIQNRTFVIEGAQSPGNLVSLLAMKNASRNPNAIFLAPSRANHFNILAPLTQLLAKKILADNGPATNIQLTESELELNYVN